MESSAHAPAGTGQAMTPADCPQDKPWRTKERNPMIKQASIVRKQLRRFLTADPERFAGGSAVSDPLGLLSVERERLAALRSPAA